MDIRHQDHEAALQAIQETLKEMGSEGIKEFVETTARKHKGQDL